MMKFNEIAFGDIASFRYGKMPDKKKITENGAYPIFSGYRITGYYNEYNLEKDELVIVARGVGGTGDVKLSPSRCYLTNLSITAEMNEDVVLKKYLYYYFAIRNLRYLDSGSAQSQITISDLEKVIIPVPSLYNQKRIVAVLSALDDKIELNAKIIANLEQQAQAIFGNLFPDCMSNGISMSSILDVRDGTHDSPKSKETGYYLITSKHLQPYSVNKNEANLISDEDYNQINERSKVEYGDILISMIGTVGLISLVSDENVDFAIKNVGLFRTSQNESLRYYILNYLKSNDVTIYIEQHLAGSTQKYISLSELRNLPINIPSKDEIIRFNSIVKPIYRYIINLNRENLRLVAIRDALLPKLMSGEISV